MNPVLDLQVIKLPAWSLSTNTLIVIDGLQGLGILSGSSSCWVPSHPYVEYDQSSWPNRVISGLIGVGLKTISTLECAFRCAKMWYSSWRCPLQGRASTAAEMTRYWAGFKQNDLQNCTIREILAEFYRIAPQNRAELLGKLSLPIPLYVQMSIPIPNNVQTNYDPSLPDLCFSFSRGTRCH